MHPRRAPLRTTFSGERPRDEGTSMAATRMSARAWLWSALSGLIGGAAFLAAAELVALLVARGASPVLAVGSFIVDVVPQPLKEFAIATFGEADKLVLLIGIGLAVAIAAALAGVLQYVRAPLGVAAFVLAGILATAASTGLAPRATRSATSSAAARKAAPPISPDSALHSQARADIRVAAMLVPSSRGRSPLKVVRSGARRGC